MSYLAVLIIINKKIIYIADSREDIDALRSLYLHISDTIEYAKSKDATLKEIVDDLFDAGYNPEWKLIERNIYRVSIPNKE